MTWLIDFIHARKWLVELILLAIVAGAIWWGCHHLIDVGVQKERAAWMLKVDEANLKAAEAKGRAAAAESTAKREHNELAQYMVDHPLHGSLASLCRKPTGVPSATPSNGSNAGTSANTHDVQPLPSRDPGGIDNEPDQLGMLSLLAKRGDEIAGQLREWQGR